VLLLPGVIHRPIVSRNKHTYKYMLMALREEKCCIIVEIREGVLSYRTVWEGCALYCQRTHIIQEALNFYFRNVFTLCTTKQIFKKRKRNYQHCLNSISILHNWEPGSSICIATGLRTGRPGFGSFQGQEIFLFCTASRSFLGPIQPPVKWVPRFVSSGVKGPECEADYSPPSSVEVKNDGPVTPLPHTSSRHGA
jgi:hypothetical protein